MTALDALIVTLALIGIPVGLWPREYPTKESRRAHLGRGTRRENTINQNHWENAE